VQELAAEQRADGGWGGFHGVNTKLKQKIGTTEVAVERALALGLEAGHPILEKAASYLVRLLKKEIPFPDRAEKNNRWPVGERLFVSSTLALIQPEHPILDKERSLWLEIARRTFQSGKYNAEDEIRAHEELTGASVKDSYLVLSSKYQLALLGSIPGALPPETRKALLKWLWNKPGGIGYLSEALAHPPPAGQSGRMDRWLASLELIGRFPSWRDFAAGAIQWLWERQTESGLWDFGPRPALLWHLPLSDTFRQPQRAFDWTTRVLILLQL